MWRGRQRKGRRALIKGEEENEGSYALGVSWLSANIHLLISQWISLDFLSVSCT